ncbi:MAG: hypothetical protein JNK14_03145 [Chitinophagaceae bacterium]|nr:hypothetical protein [Chitinophagaceae bacterium]
MKPAAAILAFILLYLSVQPPVFAVSNTAVQREETMIEFCSISKKSCAPRSSCPAEKKDIPNPCNQCVCNPLAPCCYYLLSEKTLPQIAGNNRSSKQGIPADENILSSYISDFWNPPESSFVA